MRNALTFLSVIALAALFTSGCAGPEAKLGRGMSNVAEAARGGEWRRSVEQTAVFDSPEAGYTVGFVHGFDRSVARTGVGIFEIITFPFPPYRPILSDPVYPDNYTPSLWSDSMFDTDTYVGMSGGDVAPFIPGSRFKVFDNN